MPIDTPIPIIPQPTLPPPTSVNPLAHAQVVMAPEPPDRWTALKQIGWWRPSDYVLLGLVLMTWVTGIFWKIFAAPGATQLVALFLFSVTILQVWLVMLAYRCMDFVVQLRANIEMLPFDSARIAVGFMQGGKEPQ